MMEYPDLFELKVMASWTETESDCHYPYIVCFHFGLETDPDLLGVKDLACMHRLFIDKISQETGLDYKDDFVFKENLPKNSLNESIEGVSSTIFSSNKVWGRIFIGLREKSSMVIFGLLY